MRPSRSRLARTIAVAVVLGVLVVVGRLSGGGLRHPSPPTFTIASLPAATPPSTTPSPVTAHFRLGQVTAVTVDGDAVWAAHGCAISRVEPRTDRVVATVGLPPIRRGCWVVGMQAGARAVWVSLSGEALLRIDARSSRVDARLPMANLSAPAVMAGGVWLVCCWSGINTRYPAGWVVRVDPRSMRVVARVRLGGLPTAVGVGPSGVWVTGAGGPVWRVDPASGRVVATIRVPGGLGGLPGREGPAGEVGEVLVGRDAVWVSNPAGGQVLRIDPARNRLVGGEFAAGVSLVAVAGVVWTSSGTALLALGDEVRREVSLGELGEEGELEPVRDLAASPDAVWVAAAKGLFRVDLARLP